MRVKRLAQEYNDHNVPAWSRLKHRLLDLQASSFDHKASSFTVHNNFIISLHNYCSFQLFFLTVVIIVKGG